MTRPRRAGAAIAAAISVALALAPGPPALADAITKVKGKILDNHGKPLDKVAVTFDAVEIKKRVGPLRTNKQGEFFIAVLDISVAHKWKVTPELQGYKVVKVSYEIVNSAKEVVGKQDLLVGAKQELPDLQFVLVGDDGRNVVNFVLAKDAEFTAALQEERKKREGAAAATAAGSASPGTEAPAAAAPGTPGAAPAAGAPPAAAPAAAPQPPPGGKEMLEKAKQLSDAGRQPEAIEIFRAYLAKDPNYPNAYYYLGKSLFETDDLRGAEQAFKKGLELMKEMKGAHYYLGNIALKDERPADAIPEYQKEIELTPDWDPVYVNLGQAYAQLGKDEDALAAFEKAAALNSTKPEPLMQMAAIYEKRRDAARTPDERKAAAAKGEATYERIKAIDPKNAAILFYNVGGRAKNENRTKDAVLAFRKSVEIDPGYAPAHKELAYALVATQDFRGAIMHFEEYLKLSPQAPDAKDIRQTIAALK